MVTINNLSYHDKKNNNIWLSIKGNKNNINFYGISKTNEDTTKILFLHYISYSPEEKEYMEDKVVKEGQSVTLTTSEENEIVEQIEKRIQDYK
jgi:hypothetical protein